MNGRTAFAVGGLWLAAASLGACRGSPCCPPASVATARAPETHVFLDASIVRVDRAALDALLGEASSPGTTLSAAEADALIARLRALPGADVIAAPKVLALDGQQASVVVGDGASGFTFHATPRVEGGGERVSADVRFAWKAAGEGADSATLSMRPSLRPDERGVWTVPVASSRPGARERIVLVVAMRRIEV
jgi:hypothetical protein